MNESQAKEKIARRAALEFRNGDVVNLGIGLPTLAADYIPEGVSITLQSENGILGMAGLASPEDADRNVTNAGAVCVRVNTGACFFDSAMSFTVIRGGHVDTTVLGALQVDEGGSLASHIIPGKMLSGMGGAMDLVTGSRRVVAAMTHTAKDGSPKLVTALTLPVTAVRKVHRVITELAVIDITPTGFLLREIAEGYSAEQVRNAAGAALRIEEPPGVF